ncbi:MAG TPA: alpha/beta fold hydrolase [Solirubrobacterales bacterium]|nr:alpha/beta fold hydrolase [Solirubrobacterales bacterium]
MKRIALITLVVLAGIFGMAAPAASAAPALKKCDIGANRLFRCGHIEVPAVRGLPEAGKQKIGFAIRPRGDRSRPSKGAIVFIEGGPGYAATNFDSIKPMGAVFAPFLKRHELIAIDQRGTGLSKPLLCRELQRGRVAQQKALRACAEQLGPRRQGYTTAESAADVEAVRKAIGLPSKKMILYGDSYGTYLGQSYAARYGKGMKALILSSAYPGNDPFWRTLYPAATRAVRLACKRFPECSGDALGRFKRTLKRAGTGSELTSNVLSYLMGDAASFAPNGYRNLNTAISAYLKGAPRELRELIDPGPPGSGSPRYFSEGMYAAVVCNDYPVPWDRRSPISERKRQFRRAIADFRPDDLFAPMPKRTWMTTPASDIGACLSWPGPTALMQPPIPPGTSMPGRLKTLVLAGEFDSITSVKEARQVVRRFPGGRLFVVPNRGHASELYYPFTSPATGRIRHFVKGLG